MPGSRPVPAALPALLLVLCGAPLPAAVQAATIRGRVHDGERAVPGAKVSVATQVDERLRSLYPELLPPVRRWQLVADAQGRFRLEVPAGSLYRAFATDAEGLRPSLVRHGIRPGDAFGLPLVSGGTVTLEAPGKAPLAFVLLGTDRDSRREFALCSGRVDHSMSLPLPPGPYRVRLRDERAAAAQQSFHVEPGQTMRIRPRLRDPAWLRIEGQGADAAPRTDLAVRLPEMLRFEGRAERPVEGRYPLPCLDLLLELRIGDRVEERCVLPRLQPGQELRIPAPRGEGRELRFEVERPGPDASLLLLWRSGLGVEKRLLLRTEAGFAPQGGLPRTPLLILYHDLAGRVATLAVDAERSGSVTVQPGPGCGIDLRLRAEGSREGLRPRLTAVPVTLQDAPDLAGLHPPSLHFPDLRGRLELDGLAPGRWRLLVEADRRVPVLCEVELRRGQERPVRLVELELGRRVHGRVTWPGGEPAAGVMVKLSHPLAGKDLPPLEAWTDADGGYAFEGLPEARFLVEARTERNGRTFSVRQTGVPSGPDPVGLVLADEDPVPPVRRR